MKIEFRKHFAKQYIKVPQYVRTDTDQFIAELKMCPAESVRKIEDVNKMTGTKIYYRKKIGNYRIGFSVDGETAVIYCVMERSQIYKVYPPK